MFKVVIKKNDTLEVVQSELFQNFDHATSWSAEQKLQTGFLYEISDVSAELELQKQKKEAKEYLTSSDWYVIRFMESGVEIPQDVKLKRQAARELL